MGSGLAAQAGRRALNRVPEGFVKNHIARLIDRELPDGIFAKIIRE